MDSPAARGGLTSAGGDAAFRQILWSPVHAYAVGLLFTLKTQYKPNDIGAKCIILPAWDSNSSITSTCFVVDSFHSFLRSLTATWQK